MDSLPLKINNKEVDIKLAKSRPTSKKVFVGGIDANLTKEEITSYFSNFGNVIDIELAFDKFKKKRREFCFIIYDTEESANLASKEAKQVIFNCKCDVKKATSQSVAQQQKRQQILQQSYNSQQWNYYPLNHSRNSKFDSKFYASPNSVKSGGGGSSNYPFRSGGYRAKSNSSRNSFSGRRSVDSQHGTIYEYNNSNNYNRNKNIPHHQSSNGNSNQFSTNHHESTANGQQQATKTYSNNKQYQMQLNQQQQQQPFYDQLAAQNYYGYHQMQYAANDYYALQYAQQQPHAATNNAYLHQQPNLDYYNQFNAQYYPQHSTQQQQLIQQQQQQQYLNSMNPCFTNYQSNQLDGTAMQQQQQTVQQQATADFHALDEQYYQEQQKQFENNLINTGYDNKFGSQDDVNSYQTPQLINSNLLNVPTY